MTLVRVSVHHYHLRVHLFEESPQNTWRISWELRRPQNTWRISWKPSLLPFFLWWSMSVNTIEEKLRWSRIWTSKTSKHLTNFLKSHFFTFFFYGGPCQSALKEVTVESVGNFEDTLDFYPVNCLRSCRVWRQVVRWGGADVWRLTSVSRQVWCQVIFLFFYVGSPFFLGNKTGKNTKRHDRHTDSRFRLLEGNSPKDVKGV